MRQEKGFRRHLSHFGRHSCNHSILILSDMPQTQKGSWFLHYKEKMDVEVIRAIEGLVCDIWRLKERMKSQKAAGQEIPRAWIYQLRHKNRQLNQLRSVATYYILQEVFVHRKLTAAR